MAKKSRRRKFPRPGFKPNPYLFLTGAVAASAAALLRGGDTAQADHGDWYLKGVDDGGKFYDDRIAGDCGLNDWVCYMTMLAADVNTGYPNAVSAALTKWSDTTPNTTLRYNSGSPDESTDVFFKIEDPPRFPQAHAWDNVVNADHVDCDRNTTGIADQHDCEPPASAQPQRWFHERIWINQSVFNPSPFKAVLLAHEMGHGLGLAEYVFVDSLGRRVTCPVPSIMDTTCTENDIVTNPTQTDVCSVNHASNPLMYGNDPSYTNLGC